MFARRSHRARAPRCKSLSPRVLRCEQLESRTVLSAAGPLGSLPLSLGVSPAKTGPTVVQAASAAVNSSGTVSGTSTTLSVQGSDPAGASSLVYDWKVVTAPAGGAAQFALNNNNAAQNDKVTFTAAGAYSISVTITDGSGLSTTSSVTVVVAQTPSGINLYSGSGNTLVNPATALNLSGKSETLTAVEVDQFGKPLATQPAFTWAAATKPSGAAPSFAVAGSGETVTFNEAGSYRITAQAGAGSTQFSAAAGLSVAQQPTSFVVTQVGGSVTVLGTSAQFSVGQFLDQFGNPIAESTAVAWSAKSLPSGAAAPQFSTSSGVTKVTFSHAGTYTLSVAQSDKAGNSVSDSVSVIVGQILSGMSLESGNTTVTSAAVLNVSGKTETLTAVGLDQFGNNMTAEPSFTWTATAQPSGGVPSLAAAGSGETATFKVAGSYTIKAQAGGTQFSTAANIDVIQQPTSFVVSQVGGSGNIVGTSAQFSVGQFLDQFGNPIAESTTIAWSAKSLPSGAATPQFTTSGGVTKVTFSRAGAYTLSVVQSDKAGNSVTDPVSVTVAQTPTGIASSSPLTVSGVSQNLPAPAFLDQFGNPISGLSGIAWTATTTPAGAPAVAFSGSNSATTATFGLAGKYVLTTQPANSTAAFNVAVTVTQTLTGISATPGTARVALGTTEQFQVQGLDQFRQAMASTATVAWTATGGTISSSGLFTAGSTTGTYSVTAKSGSLTSSAVVTVATPGPAPAKLQDPVLASLVTKLDADGSLSRADLIQILTSVGTGGSVSATDLADLKAILADAAAYNMPNYVQVLANDVVNGNVANATYQGAALGNLAGGSSAQHLDDLIDKWFYGSDLPVVTSSAITYETVSGSLFPTTPSNKDEYQGELGDCYFISSLGAIADSNPSAVENMFINNGDGTYTVRFYTSNGTADYVTVNLELPTYYGVLVYADYGASPTSANNSLWIPLAEKAYAEWNQTGNEGRDGTNTYNSIQGGWMANVDQQVLGHGASGYGLASSTEQAMISALAGDQAVTIGTDTSNNSGDTLPGGLFGSHAYAVLSYRASSGTFTLYNPWGFDQPSALTWNQLEATCDGFVTTVTSGSTPISSGVTTSVGVMSVSAATSITPSISLSSAAWTTVPAKQTPAVAAAGNGSTSQQAPIFSGLPRHASLAHATGSPLAAGVDAVLTGPELGDLFAVGRFVGTTA